MTSPHIGNIFRAITVAKCAGQLSAISCSNLSTLRSTALVYCLPPHSTLPSIFSYVTYVGARIARWWWYKTHSETRRILRWIIKKGQWTSIIGYWLAEVPGSVGTSDPVPPGAEWWPLPPRLHHNHKLCSHYDEMLCNLNQALRSGLWKRNNQGRRRMK